MNKNRRLWRLAAALCLIPFALIGFGYSHVIGGSLLLIAAGVTVREMLLMWREREDPYDLSRIWDEAPDPEVPEGANRDLELAFCRHCGTASPNTYGVCPECGNPR